MFPSMVVPAILQVRPELCLEKTEQREKVAASMPVEKSADRPGDRAFSDELALEKLYEQFRRPIHSYVYRLLGNVEDADDITQEVFIRACSAWDGLYERDHLSSWLYRIATNLCVDQLRRRKRISWWPLSRRSRQAENDDDVSDDASLLLADSGGIPEIAEREHIRLTLANMPEEYAAALVLHAAQGVPYQEIAAIMEISPNAAATRISRAKKMFMEQYKRLNKSNASVQERRK
ncbi:RNA polymerase sigma factor [Ktedonobacter racemifer]|uniref:RNA polymerase, sigma-24 subunit, ECF subfamily n=1 Tax=Ktedonobacter racemifer DSM 44963 TaxID=485913 RepID=D6TEZ7_KTERA|nr:RNA polymerase sigma factor [Ktedonobacter racemifer]EFH90397.1 RNA polymerase, sigma-24 subunit, ECF subfamily [Ktedonobacter racemifer DSM 44963]